MVRIKVFLENQRDGARPFHEHDGKALNMSAPYSEKRWATRQVVAAFCVKLDGFIIAYCAAEIQVDLQFLGEQKCGSVSCSAASIADLCGITARAGLYTWYVSRLSLEYHSTVCMRCSKRKEKICTHRQWREVLWEWEIQGRQRWQLSFRPEPTADCFQKHCHVVQCYQTCS